MGLTGTRSHLIGLVLLASASVASAGWNTTDFFPGTGYSAVATGYPGDSDCPCIDPFSDPYNVAEQVQRFNWKQGVRGSRAITQAAVASKAEDEPRPRAKTVSKV